MHTPFLLTDTHVRHLGEGALLQVDGFATEDEVEDWSETIARSQADFTQAGTGAGRVRNTDVRTDRTAWEADLPGRFHGMRERFVEVRTELNAAAWMGLDAFAIQLAVFEPGGHYQAHRDALRADAARRVTAILYLNPRWCPADGGCLRVHGTDAPRDIEPQGGRLVVFLSDRVLHEVLPARVVRQAATAWFRGYDRP